MNRCIIEQIEFNGEKILVRKEEGYSSIHESPDSFFKEYRFKFHDHFIIVHRGRSEFIKVDGIKTIVQTQIILVEGIDIEPIIRKVDEADKNPSCKFCGCDDFKYRIDSSNGENLILCSCCDTILESYFKHESEEIVN